MRSGNCGAFAATSLILLAACQTSGRTDASGRAIQLSEEQPIGLAETTLNIVSFLDTTVAVEVKRTVRDNTVPSDAYTLRDSSGGGIVRSNHAGGNIRWSNGEDYWNEPAFRERAAKTLSNLREIREIRHRNAKVGYRAVGTSKQPGVNGILAATAYDLLGTTAHFRTGSFDTSVELLYCAASPDAARFDRLLSELDLVHDRGAYRTALQGRQASAVAALPAPRPSTLQLRNPLTGRWEGVADSMTGIAESTDDGTGGTVSFALPGGNDTCKGTFLYAAGRTSGRWTAACTNELTASGTFESLGTNKGFRGTGTDNRGRLVSFTIGTGTAPSRETRGKPA